MAKILQIDSSSRSATSVTRLLTQHFVDDWREQHPHDSLKYRDLAETGVAFLNETALVAMNTPAEQRTAEQNAALLSIERDLDEFIAADIYVLGVPMYNFGVPAVFKAFIDHIVTAGKTFAYLNGQPQGLLKGKRAFVIISSGGNYDQPPMSNYDFVEPYLRMILGFIGITDVNFIKVQGHSPEIVNAEIARAQVAIKTLTKQDEVEQLTITA